MLVAACARTPAARAHDAGGEGSVPMTDEPTDLECTPRLDDGGLPQRTPAIVARERSIYELSTGTLGGGKGSPQARVTTGDLHRAWSGGRAPRFAVAFLIGRCRAADAAADARLTALVEAGLADPGAAVRVESAMALVLRGQRERGETALKEIAATNDRFSDDYKAAYYLAQLGDPAGYPVVVASIRGDLAHYRLMAARHVIAWQPYDGQEIAGHAVDPRALLVERLQDPEPIVRAEIPRLLKELGVPDLIELVQPLATGDPDPSVRAAAEMTLAE
jgi:hypothetical protein